MAGSSPDVAVAKPGHHDQRDEQHREQLGGGPEAGGHAGAGIPASHVQHDGEHEEEDGQGVPVQRDVEDKRRPRRPPQLPAGGQSQPPQQGEGGDGEPGVDRGVEVVKGEHPAAPCSDCQRSDPHLGADQGGVLERLVEVGDAPVGQTSPGPEGNQVAVAVAAELLAAFPAAVAETPRFRPPTEDEGEYEDRPRNPAEGSTSSCLGRCGQALGGRFRFTRALGSGTVRRG